MADGELQAERRLAASMESTFGRPNQGFPDAYSALPAAHLPHAGAAIRPCPRGRISAAAKAA
ncbi:hypothetical protein WJ39_28550 [Burkholderia diffusa]|nr:hypothetical protein WJ39_28550 [Burkholderia diffusa]